MTFGSLWYNFQPYFRSTNSAHSSFGDCCSGPTFHYGRVGSPRKWRGSPTRGLQSGCAWRQASHVDGGWSRGCRRPKAQSSRACCKYFFKEPLHSVWKSLKKSHSTLRAKRATFTFWVDKSEWKTPKIVNFGEFLKTWIFRSDSVTRQANFDKY